MRQLSFLLGSVALLGGIISVAEAQTTRLPANPATQLAPLIPAPDDAAPDAHLPSFKNVTENPTLPTTTVQSGRSIPNPNLKVTADRYYSMNGTTGSYQVNAKRARDVQSAALQKARLQKELKEEMSSVRHYRMTYDSKSAVDYLNDNPPHPNPAPLTGTDSPPSAATGGDVPANATYPDNRNSAPPEPEIQYVDMRKPGERRVADRFKKSKSKIPAVSETLAYNPENPAPEVGNSTAPAPPMPPTSVFRPTPPPQINPGQPEKKGLFARFRGETPTVPEVQPPVDPTVSAVAISDLPPEPAYPADDSVPTFAIMGNEISSSSAVVSPPEKKTLFSMFGKKKSQLPEANSPSMASDESVPPSSFQPNNPAPPKPTIKSIFRPDASARKANAYSKVKGEEVYATVDGEEVKLSEGTRVRILREGSSRSLVRLYDNRQATIANSALVPETE